MARHPHAELAAERYGARSRTICYDADVALLIPELPRCSAFELASAVRRMITDGPRSVAAPSLDGQLPTSDALREAGELLVDARGDLALDDLALDDLALDDRARDENARALALLEAPYLVAASDGLDAEERQAMSALLSHLVGSVTPEAVCDVLSWFDSRLAEEGLQARLAYIAANFETRRDREQVLAFAALLALADRRLALTEQQTLLELADVLGFKRVELQMLVHKISLRLERAMAVSIAPSRLPPADPGLEQEPGSAADESPTDTQASAGDRFTPAPETPPAGSRAGGVPPTERSS